uniref:TATA element modulatory factor 1 TATA binding domain-containing protein n=1 Tax=Percolomonas cosmopolitus TaxID=63605 RepID=A0A6U0L1M0_9EUKA
MSFGGFSSWIKTFESKIDEALDIKTEESTTRKSPEKPKQTPQKSSAIVKEQPVEVEQRLQTEANVEISVETMKLLRNLICILDQDVQSMHGGTQSQHILQDSPNTDDQEYIRQFVADLLQRCVSNQDSSSALFMQHFLDFKHIFQKVDAFQSTLVQSISQKDSLIKELRNKCDNVNTSNHNQDDAQIKSQFETLKKEFSLRLGKEEQRNAKLNRENQKLRKEHAEYDAQLATLHAKEAEIRKLTDTAKDLNNHITQQDRKVALLKKENTNLDATVASLEKQTASFKAQLAQAEQEKSQHTKLIEHMKALSEEPNGTSPLHSSDDTNLAQNVIQKLKNSIQEAEDQAKAAKDQLQSEIEKLKQSHSSQTMELESMFHKKEIQLRQNMQQLERSLVQLTDEKNEKELVLKKEIASLQHQRLSAEKETEVLLAEHLPETTESLHEEIRLLSQKNAQQKQALEMEKQQMQNKVRLLQNQVKLVEVERDSVRHDYNQQKNQLKNMDNALQQERSRNSQQENSVCGLEHTVTRLQRSIDEHVSQESVLRSELCTLKEQYHALAKNAQQIESKQQLSISSHQEEFTPESSPSKSVHSVQAEDDDDLSTSAGGYDVMSAPANGAVLDGDRAPTRFEYLQMYSTFRKQNEYILLMNQKIHKLEQSNEKLSDQVVAWKNNAASEQEKQHLFDQMKKEHDTALLLLGEKQTEVLGLTQDLDHVKTMFRSQVCDLLEQIEELKGSKR